MNKKSRILALDVGKKRIGLALSDELRMFASPYGNVDLGNDRSSAIREILKLCSEKEVTDIVIGKPLSLGGEETEQTKFTEKFAEALEKKLQAESEECGKKGEENTASIKIHFIDERLTSVQAEQYLGHSGKKNLDRRKAKDQISASIILETYLLSLPKSGGYI